MRYCAAGELRTLRKGNNKLHPRAARSGELLDEPLLYDLRQNIGEQQNLAQSKPEVFKEMMALADSVSQSIPRGKPVFYRRLKGTSINPDSSLRESKTLTPQGALRRQWR